MTDYLTVDEIAQRKLGSSDATKAASIAETLRRILRNDARRARIFPGAIKRATPDGRHVEWAIPEAEALAWHPSGRGRPRETRD